jgi:hypothetical protein
VCYYFTCSRSIAVTISFAQQEETSLGEKEEEDLAGNIISNVLDSGDDRNLDQDNNTADQDAANVGLQDEDLTQEQEEEQEQ